MIDADGGSRRIPGRAGYGAVVLTHDGEILAEVAEGIGRATNNVAEYRGVIAGLASARALGARRVHVRADSKLVICQLGGQWKVRQEHLGPLWREARALADGFDRVRYEHVRREFNGHADALANRAMDAQAAGR